MGWQSLLHGKMNPNVMVIMGWPYASFDCLLFIMYEEKNLFPLVMKRTCSVLLMAPLTPLPPPRLAFIYTDHMNEEVTGILFKHGGHSFYN